MSGGLAHFLFLLVLLSSAFLPVTAQAQEGDPADSAIEDLVDAMMAVLCPGEMTLAECEQILTELFAAPTMTPTPEPTPIPMDPPGEWATPWPGA